MKINEIFHACNGESKFGGLATIFIRTYSCSLRCRWCDTPYSWQGNEFTDMSVCEIMEHIKKYNCKRITLTGGEPLLQHDALDLVQALVDARYQVEIETNGAVDISPYTKFDNVLITMDWKCKGSGEQSKMIDGNLDLLRPTDVIKFVVSSQQDLEEMEQVSLMTQAEAYVSPVFGEIELKDLIEYVLDHNLNDVRVQVQMHKIAYPVDMRGV